MNIDIKLYSRDENDFIIPWAEKIGKELITMQYSVHNLFMFLDDNGQIDLGHSRIYYSYIPENTALIENMSMRKWICKPIPIFFSRFQSAPENLNDYSVAVVIPEISITYKDGANDFTRIFGILYRKDQFKDSLKFSPSDILVNGIEKELRNAFSKIYNPGLRYYTRFNTKSCLIADGENHPEMYKAFQKEGDNDE